MRPLISNIVLSYNRREETLECLRSLRRQTWTNTETIVLDNGSGDGSADAIAEAFPEVFLIRMPCNYGAWHARDIAIQNSHGKYLFMIDSDAVAPEDALEQLLTRIELEPELGIIQPRILDQGTNATYDMGFGRDRSDESFYRWQFHGCAALLRRRAYDAAGGFPHHYLVAGGEAYLAIPMIDAGYRILYYPKVSVRHALSPKERIPRQRLLMSNLHRMQNNASFNPYLGRVWLDLFWKVGLYTAKALRRGYVRTLPWDVSIHFVRFLRTLRRWRRPIRPETQNLIDYLMSHQVSSREEYERIDSTRTHFAKRSAGALVQQIP